MQISTSAGANLFNLLDLLSGGTISNFSILAMGVYPYITAQIILQLLVPIIPALDRRLKDNPREGRSLMEKWTTMLTIPMAFLSAIGQVNIFNSMTNNAGTNHSIWFYWSEFTAYSHFTCGNGCRYDVRYLAWDN